MRRLILVAAVFLAAVGPGHAQQTVETSVVPAGGAVPGTQVEFVTLGEALTAFGSGNVVGVGFAFTVIPAAVNQAPNAPSLLFPVDGIALNFSTPTFQWTGTDPNAGDVLTFNLEISTVSDFSTLFLSSTGITGVPVAGVFEASFTAASPLPENIYFWRVAAFDGALTGPFASSTFIVDLTSPSLAIAFPVDGSTIATATPAILADYADALSGISTQTVAMFLNGSSVTPSVSLSSVTFTPSPPLTDGFRTVMVEVRDRAGNVAQATSTFRVDTTTPTVAVVSPLHGSTVATSQPLIVSTYSDVGSGINIASVTIILEGVDVTTQATITASSATFASFFLADGTRTVTVSVADFAGNRASSTSTFLVDTTSPTVTIVRPVNGSTEATSQPLIVSTYTDAGAGINISSVALILDGVDVTTQAIVTISSVTFVPAALANGPHTVTVFVADLLGFSALATSIFQVDTTSPIVTIVSPVNDSIIPADTTPLFISTYTNGIAGVNVAGVQLFLDTANVTGLATITVSSATFTPFTLALGTHVFTIVVPDNVGNTTTASSTFTAIDPSSPTIQNNMLANAVTTWFNIAPGAIIDIDFFDAGGSHLSRFETMVTTDAGGVGIALQPFITVQSSADFGAFTDSFTAEWALLPGTFDLMQQGTNYVSVRVFDQAGNFAVAPGTFTILKDTVAPNVPAGILFVGGGAGVAPTPVPAGGNRTITWCVDPATQLCAATLVATDTVSGFSAFPVSLFYSTNSGVDFVLIASGVANSPAGYLWSPIPIINSTQTVLRIAYTDLAGNTAGQNGAQFTIGQPDLFLPFSQVTVTKAGPNLRLTAQVSNIGLVTAQGPITVNFFSAPISLNNNKAFNGNITSGGTSPSIFETTPFPPNQTFTVTFTADPLDTITESNEANNSTDAVVVTSVNAVLSVTACSVHTLFSKVFVSFSAVFGVKDSQEHPMTTSAREFDFVRLHQAQESEIAAIGSLPPGLYSGLRLMVASARGVRADNGETVSLEVTSPLLAVPLSFNIAADELNGGKVFLDLAQSIRAEPDGRFTFSPVLLQAQAERRSWEVTLASTAVTALLGQTFQIPVSIANTGTVDDSYDVNFFSPQQALAAVSPFRVAVPHGSSVTVALQVTAPGDIGGARTTAAFSIDVLSSIASSGSDVLGIPASKIATGTVEILGDIQPPRSTMVAGQPSFGTDPIAISSRTLLGILSVDDLIEAGDGRGLGVADIQFAIGTGPFQKFVSSFTVSQDGLTPIRFFATDIAGNVETVKTSTVSVDATAPTVALVSPNPNSVGLSQLFNGVINIVGTAADANFARFTLKLSVGAQFSETFTVIAIGTSPVLGGTLGIIDSSSLIPGFFTLRLEAADAVGNLSSTDATFFVGQPSVDLAIGATPGLNHPQGVATDSQGNIWISDTNNDVLRKFAPDGTLLATFDGLQQTLAATPTAGNGKSSKPVVEPAPAGFQKLQGIDVDPNGNVVVADTNNNRIARVSSAGVVTQVIGRVNPSGGLIPGHQPGEFNHPSDVSVDKAGKMYVADTNNGRLQVLDAEGNPVQVITMPLPPGATVAQPAGVAVDAQGNIYAADQANNLIRKFDAAGNLVGTFGSFGAAPGQLHKPQGLRMSETGFVYVADRNNDRVQKFDALGNLAAVLGGSGNDPGQFNKPAAVGIDAAGRLYIADTNNGRVQRMVLGSAATTIVSVSKPKRVEQPITPQGGEIKHHGGQRLVVPDGALDKTVSIGVEVAESASAQDPARLSRMQAQKLAAALPAMDFTPEGTQFAKPVLVSIPYDPLALNGVKEKDLKLYYWNPNTSTWEAVETSQVDTNKKVVTALLAHFSHYQVMGPGAQPESQAPSALDASFRLGEVYAFPNPARAGAKPKFHIEVGEADQVEIRIYSMSGSLLHQTTLSQAPQIVDDGQGPQYAYEYTWEGHIPSGVYLYTIRAKRSGSGELSKAGRLAVVR